MQVKAIALVASGLRTPKKADNPVARLIRYVNYGLIGLATTLQRHGYRPLVFHGHFDEPGTVAARALSHQNPALPLLLSVPSVNAVPWAADFCAEVRTREPKLKIAVGGRWVTLDDADWVLSRIPADLVVFGEAEDRITRIATPAEWANIPGTDRVPRWAFRAPPEVYPQLDYDIVEGCTELTPSVEVSRGCGRRCAFCVEADAPFWRLRRVPDLAAQIRAVQNVYNEFAGLKLYFECSSFAASRKWAKELEREQLHVAWRTEARVDALRPDVIPGLARSGLRVLDLGLESASPLTLTRMNKTDDPATYLAAADLLLRACHEHGVWAKLNVVLYAGETKDTVSQTRDWLVQRSHMIKGVSAGPLIAYRTMRKTHHRFLAHITALGARPVDDRALDSEGMAELHLSPEIDRDAAQAYARDISRALMTERDYFDLKSFGYFPRSLTFSRFQAHVDTATQEALPFRRV
jgi:radical SAM superfamily enzyme YgiQ (UPF0313 family)